MGMFSGISTAKATSRSGYFSPGVYLCEIAAIKFRRSDRPGKGPYFVVECLVKESNRPDTQPGETRSWSLTFRADDPMALGDMKAFFVALSGATEAEVSPFVEALAEAAIGDENPCRGLLVRLEAFERDTKAGGQFTVHRWERAAPQLDAIRAIVGKAPTAKIPPPPCPVPDGFTWDGSNFVRKP